MGLAAKRFLQGGLRRRLEPVIPVKAVVVNNEERSSCKALPPTKTKAIKITHDSIVLSPPMLKIVLERFQTLCIEESHRSINRPEKQRNSYPIPIVFKKPLRDHSNDKDDNTSRSVLETVPSSSILLQTHCSEGNSGAIEQYSGKKRNSPQNPNHQTTETRVKKVTTEIKSNGGDTTSQSNWEIREKSLPKNLKTHCKEGKYWAIDLSGKKRDSPNHRATRSPLVVARRSAMESKMTRKELQKLQSHCGEGGYWQIDPSSFKRKRSASTRLVTLSPEKKKKHRKRKTRTKPGRCKNTVNCPSQDNESSDTTEASNSNETNLTMKTQTGPSKWYWLVQEPEPKAQLLPSNRTRQLSQKKKGKKEKEGIPKQAPSRSPDVGKTKRSRDNSTNKVQANDFSPSIFPTPRRDFYLKANKRANDLILSEPMFDLQCADENMILV